jgi:hypothetical protein
MILTLIPIPTPCCPVPYTKTSVSDPHVFCADPNTDLNPAQNLNPDPDPAHRKMLQVIF